MITWVTFRLLSSLRRLVIALSREAIRFSSRVDPGQFTYDEDYITCIAFLLAGGAEESKPAINRLNAECTG